MSLGHILLGILRQPSNGYELKLWFERAFRHFWAAEPSQIYRTLSVLEKSRQLSATDRESSKGPPRRVYRTTARGRASLRAWINQGPALSDNRQSHLAQVLFLGEVEPAQRRTFMDELCARYRGLLEELEALRRTLPDQADPAAPCDDDEFFRRLTLDAGVHQYKSWLQWSERARALLDGRSASQTAAGHEERIP